jgi:prepilin-type N-terminal cleavage/methylation domain-containing protein
MSRVLPASRGISLVEVLIAVAIVGVLASIAVPALLGARRHANQTAAMASLRAVADAQQVYAASCAAGAYASRLSHLAEPPAGGGEGFLAPDLAASDRVVKSGYVITMARGSDGTEANQDSCNGISAADLTSSFFATAVPESPVAGSMHYWTGVSGIVFASRQPIVSTLGQAEPAGAQPAGGMGDRPLRRRNAELPHLDVR